MQNLKGSCSEKTWQPLSVPVWYLPHLSICLCIVFLPLLECKHYESRIKNFFPLFIILSLVSSHFIYLKNFNWTIVELQCCVNYCCTVKWLSYTHIYILFHIFFQYGLSQNIEYSSLCYSRTLLFIHSIYNSLHLLSQTPTTSLSHPACYLNNHEFILYVHESVSVS